MSHDKATECSADVGALAKDRRFAPRADELHSLAADLKDPDGDMWAGVDLFAAFPPESSIELRHRNTVERIVGVFAAVSVFLPVGWTWSEFRRASAAYEDMINEGGEPEGRTFLGLWATGFDGRLEAGSHLAPMAMVSVSLIIFAIFCLVAHRLVADTNVRREEREFRAARTELVQHLTAAALVMNARRADHPQRIEGVIKSSMDKLRKTQDAARKAVVELSATTENVNTGVRELLESVHSARSEAEALLTQAKSTNEALEAATTRTGETLTKSITSLDTTVKAGVEATNASVTDSVQALDSVLRESVQATRDNVASSAQELSQQLSRALTQFQRAMGSHLDGLTNQTVTAIGTSGEALMGVIDRIGGSAQSSAAAADSLAEQVSIMRDDQAVARDELANSIADIRATLESIENALGRHASTLQGQTSELTGTRDAAERMLRQLTTSVASTNGNGSHPETRS
jgi:hypothetical protein